MVEADVTELFSACQRDRPAVIAAIAQGCGLPSGRRSGLAYARGAGRQPGARLAGAYLPRRSASGPSPGLRLIHWSPRPIYIVVFVALAAEQHLPAWLALPMIVRDLAWRWAAWPGAHGGSGTNRYERCRRSFYLVLASMWPRVVDSARPCCCSSACC